MKRASAFLCLALITGSGSPASAAEASQSSDSAQTGASETDSPDAAKPEEEQGPALVPYRRDTVGGHVQVGLSGTFSLPFGSLSDGVSHKERSGNGWGLALDAGYGINRQVALAAYGELQWLGDSSGCTECSSTGLGTGMMLRYHLAQGLRLDPWVSYGLGYRSLNSSQNDNALSYAGLEWMRLGMGATWFASPNFGFGPTLNFSAASLFKVPDDEEFGGVSWRMDFGLRLVFDTPGK